MLRRWNEESHNGKTLLQILAYEFLSPEISIDISVALVSNW